MLELVDQTRGLEHSGQEIQESEEQRANRLLKTLLAQFRWTDSTLRSTPKGAPEKIKLAQALRQQTTMTSPWIASRLHRGNGHLTHLLYWHKRGKKAPVKKRRKASKLKLGRFMR